ELSAAEWERAERAEKAAAQAIEGGVATAPALRLETGVRAPGSVETIPRETTPIERGSAETAPAETVFAGTVPAETAVAGPPEPSLVGALPPRYLATRRLLLVAVVVGFALGIAAFMSLRLLAQLAGALFG
ncbi:MAG: hypothetical protein WDA71_09995, partial [Actinomycetota bacterium]